MMKLLTCTQGSPEWHEARAKHFCASEAAAMLGLSKYMTRTELLRQKATGVIPEVDAGKQYLFDAGHAAEAAARPVVEAIIGDELFPCVCTLEAEGLPLLASMDGLAMDETTAWETKLLNQSLVSAINLGEVPDAYWPQLEQGMLVSGAEKVFFTSSDGTPEGTYGVWYSSQPERRAALIAGWKQFSKDLEEYQHVEIIPAAVAAPQMQLPAVSVQVAGSIQIRDNLTNFSDALASYVERINKQPETDQDFADLEASVKTLKAAEDALDAAESNALAQTDSIDAMRRTVELLRAKARSVRLMIEKIVKAEKENRRAAIVQKSRADLVAHIDGLNALIGKPYLPQISADFAGKIKGLKTMSSIQNAVDTELARCKVEATGIANKIEWNMTALKEDAAGYDFLFRDEAQLVLKNADDLALLIKSRIGDHKATEEKRIEAEREKIRAEEEAKAIGKVKAAQDAEKLAAAKLEEQKRINTAWAESIALAVEYDAREKSVAEAAKAIKEIPIAEEHPPALVSKIFDAALRTAAAIEPEIVPNSVWAKAHDEVAAMLEDMSIPELALARIALAKIRNDRMIRA